MPPRKPATDPASGKAKAPARMMIPLSERAEQLVRKTAIATGRTLSSVLAEIASRPLEGKPLLDGLAEKVCRDLVADHAQAMQRLFSEPDNGPGLDPDGDKKAEG